MRRARPAADAARALATIPAGRRIRPGSRQPGRHAPLCDERRGNPGNAPCHAEPVVLEVAGKPLSTAGFEIPQFGVVEQVGRKCHGFVVTGIHQGRQTGVRSRPRQARRTARGQQPQATRPASGEPNDCLARPISPPDGQRHGSSPRGADRNQRPPRPLAAAMLARWTPWFRPTDARQGFNRRPTGPPPRYAAKALACSAPRTA